MSEPTPKPIDALTANRESLAELVRRHEQQLNEMDERHRNERTELVRILGGLHRDLTEYNNALGMLRGVLA